MLDLSGYSLICRGCTSSTTAIGIHASNRRDITIKNGHVIGFYYGAKITNSEGYVPLRHDHTTAPTNIVVQNLRLRGNFFRGVRVEARGARIEDNLIVDTGGSTVHANAYAFAIESFGGGATIEGNTIYNTYGVGTGEGVGISVSDFGVGTIVRDNRIANAADSNATGTASYGIWIGGGSSPGSNVVVDDNTVVISKVAAIRMGGPGVKAIVTDNLISVNPTAYGVWFSDNTSGIYGNNTTYGARTKYQIDTPNVSAAAANY